MKVQCDIVLDLETGSYDLKFHNLTQPGAAMDYVRLRKVLRRIIEDFDEKQMKKR